MDNTSVIQKQCSLCGEFYETVIENDSKCPNCHLDNDIKIASHNLGDASAGGCRCGCPSSIASFPNELKF